MNATPSTTHVRNPEISQMQRALQSSDSNTIRSLFAEFARQQDCSSRPLRQSDISFDSTTAQSFDPAAERFMRAAMSKNSQTTDHRGHVSNRFNKYSHK